MDVEVLAITDNSTVPVVEINIRHIDEQLFFLPLYSHLLLAGFFFLLYYRRYTIYYIWVAPCCPCYILDFADYFYPYRALWNVKVILAASEKEDLRKSIRKGIDLARVSAVEIEEKVVGIGAVAVVVKKREDIVVAADRNLKSVGIEVTIEIEILVAAKTKAGGTKSQGNHSPKLLPPNLPSTIERNNA